MVTIYVWKRSLQLGSFGHAALEVDGGNPPGRAYISWWPSDGSVAEQVYLSTAPRVHRNLHEDVNAERRLPDVTIRVEGLDESKIKAYWRSWSSHGRYSGLKLNCASTVGNALIVGGGSRVAAGWEHKHVWTPEDCALLGNQISARIRAAICA